MTQPHPQSELERPALPAPDPPRRSRGYVAVLRVLALVAVLGVGTWLLAGRFAGWQHLRAGRAALEAHHVHTAFAELQQALDTWPDDAEVQFLAARAARLAGAYPAADHLLNQCAAAPDLADRLVLECVLLRAARGEVEEVEPFCRGLLDQEHPETPWIVEALTQGYLTALRLPDASFLLERWLQRSPDHPQALYLKGRLQVQAGNQQEAISLFRRVVALDPERGDARQELAALHLDLGQAHEALEHLEWLRQHLPEDALTRVRLARCLDLLGQQDEAMRLLDAVLAERPHVASALLERGKLALRAEQPELAARYLTEASRREPGSYEAQYHLMQCLRAQGKRAEADRALARMTQIEKDAQRLREIAATPANLLPRSAALHAEVGSVLLRLGAIGQAERWLQKAVHLDPRNTAAHEVLARHYQALGQTGKAEQHRRLAGRGTQAKQ